MIVNAKSGICPEDGGYCLQSIVSTADISKYSMVRVDAPLAELRAATAPAAG